MHSIEALSMPLYAARRSGHITPPVLANAYGACVASCYWGLVMTSLSISGLNM